MDKKIYELSIAKDYVHTWGIEEAIREIMQNAIDSETDGNQLSVSYNNGTLVIQNIGCDLNVSQLVLGNTSKDDDEKYIGTYGEGFKLALVVLLRNGINVSIKTNNQEWIPEFRKSRKFKIDTLHIDVYENSIGGQGIIAFELKGLDYDTFKRIRSKNLAMLKAMNHSIGKTVKSEYGEILLDKEYKGMMFVNGLFIQEDGSFKYGYDFKSEYVHLDRDRRALNYYQLRELTAKSLTSQPIIRVFNSALDSNSIDVRDIAEHMDKISMEFKENFAKDFATRHNIGEDTFVGTKKQIAASDLEKTFEVDNVAIADLVNYGQGKEEEYDELKSKVENLSEIEQARNYYERSDFKKMLEFVMNKKNRFSKEEIAEFYSIVSKYSSMWTSYFSRISDEIFKKLGFPIDEEEKA